MKLKIIRLKRGLTQEELGKRLGVTQQYISKIENGDIDGITLGKTKELAKVFKMFTLEMTAILLEEEYPHICKQDCNLWKEEEE